MITESEAMTALSAVASSVAVITDCGGPAVTAGMGARLATGKRSGLPDGCESPYPLTAAAAIRGSVWAKKVRPRDHSRDPASIHIAAFSPINAEERRTNQLCRLSRTVPAGG